MARLTLALQTRSTYTGCSKDKRGGQYPAPPFPKIRMSRDFTNPRRVGQPHLELGQRVGWPATLAFSSLLHLEEGWARLGLTLTAHSEPCTFLRLREALSNHRF